MDSFQMLSSRMVESDIETEIISSEDMAEMQVDHTALGGQLGTAEDTRDQEARGPWIIAPVDADDLEADHGGTDECGTPDEVQAPPDPSVPTSTVVVELIRDPAVIKSRNTSSDELPEPRFVGDGDSRSVSAADCRSDDSLAALKQDSKDQTEFSSVRRPVLPSATLSLAESTVHKSPMVIPAFVLPTSSTYGSCPTLNLQELIYCLQKSQSGPRYRKPALGDTRLRPIRCAHPVMIPFASSSAISSGARNNVRKLPIPADPLRTTFSYPLYPPQLMDVEASEDYSGGNPESAEENGKIASEKPAAKPRSCRCSKSNCLKLYCDCFSLGEVCGAGCSCQNCFNNEGFPSERTEATNTILKKKPDAFKRRPGTNGSASFRSKPKTGCRCRKSECLKNYCECFLVNERCGDLCVCLECKNTIDHIPIPPGSSSRRRRTNRKKSIRNITNPSDEKKSVILDSILRQRVAVKDASPNSV